MSSFLPLSDTSGHDGGGRRGEGQLKEEGGVDRPHLQSFRVDEPRSESEKRVCTRARSVTQAVTKAPIGNTTLDNVMIII